MATKNDPPLPDIFYGMLELHGDLFFASLEFHDVVETLPVIHNYALTYALDLCTAETGRITPLYWSSERRQQQPRYLDDFASLINEGIYVTPAKSPDGLPPTVIRQYATRIDEYLHFGRKIEDVLWWEKNPKKRTGQTLGSFFPLYGYLKVVAVGARFLFYVYNAPTELPMARFIRLGKFNTKAAVTLSRCQEVYLVENAEMATHPVNPIDVTGTIPLHLITMRPTPLAMIARLPRTQVLKVTHPHPWKKDGSAITNYLPYGPYYGGTTGGGNAAISGRSRQTTPKSQR
jgi:CRISPR-associated protein Csc1